LRTAISGYFTLLLLFKNAAQSSAKKPGPMATASQNGARIFHEVVWQHIYGVVGVLASLCWRLYCTLNFWATVLQNSSPYATGPLSCLSVCPILSATLVYCGQMARWIKMPLGTEVGLGPSNIVLDGDPAPHQRKGAQQPTLFGPCLLYCLLSLVWRRCR